MGPFKKYVRSEWSDQKRTLPIKFAFFPIYMKNEQGEGLSKIDQIWANVLFERPLCKKAGFLFVRSQTLWLYANIMLYVFTGNSPLISKWDVAYVDILYQALLLMLLDLSLGSC